LEQLSEGLCTTSMLCKFEKGKRLPDKLCRDRLLARMGKGTDVYETYLEFEGYHPWECRQQILQSIVSFKEEYSEFQRPFEMQDNCYLFLEKEAYCIGDVI